MERYALKLQHICVLSALLVFGAAANLYLYVASSKWSLIFNDKVEDQVVIPEVSVVGEWPVSDATLQRVLNNQPLDAKIFKVDVRKGVRFDPQFRGILTELNVSSDQSLENIKYAMFFDINHRDLESVVRPYLFFFGTFAPCDIYINGQLVKVMGDRVPTLAPTQILGNADTYRVVFVVQNSFPHIVAGPNFHSYGLSVRPEQSVSDTLLFQPIKAQFPRIATSVCFLIFGLLALVLGLSAREYVDIWAYSSFCIAAGLYSWSFTPMFYMTYVSSSSTHSLFQAIFGTMIVLSAAVLTLGYFRLEGRHFKFIDAKGVQLKSIIKSMALPFRATLIIGATGCVINLVNYQPWREGTNLNIETPIFNANLVWVLALTQTSGFAFGFLSLIRLRRHLMRAGLAAQAVLVKRRIMHAGLFAVGMAMMMAVYGMGFATVNKISGNDLYISGSIFPALVMLLMFLGMVNSGQRFYKKFTPRLGQIDHEIMAFGAAALEKRYHGVLMVFDVAGMKALNVLRLTDKRYEVAVDAMIGRIEHDLSALVQAGRVTFRYKSNGDEFIFAMWAKDAVDASAQFVQLMEGWRETSAGLMASWKAMLAETLQSAALKPMIEMLDIHVMACTMKDIKITVKGGIETPTAGPDFFDPRFTQLSAMFKPSRWNKVAMFKDDAELLMKTSAVFAAEKGMEMGFWEFAGSDKNVVEKVAS